MNRRVAIFPEAVMVAVDDAITSTQYARLANAFNARARLCVGDPNWRSAHYSLAIARQIRNPDTSGFLMPSEAEWHEFYSHLNELDRHWPDADPGDPEGVNLANPMAAYIYGAESLNLWDEATRMSDPFYGGLTLQVPGGDAPEAARFWYLRKQQCGGWDPVSGATACPAFDVARSYAVIRHGRTSMHGNEYGGFLPGPEVLGVDCDPLYSGGPTPANFQITFTALDETVSYTGACGSFTAGGYECDMLTPVAGTLTYPGTCQQTDACLAKDDPSWTPAPCYECHVAGIIYTPWSYYVILYGDSLGTYTVEELPTTQWAEGPYCGRPRLQKRFGNVLERVMWEFIRGWRGSEGDQVQPVVGGAPPSGDPPKTWLENAFDVQRFFREQYALAPSAGSVSGGSVNVVFPSFQAGPGAFTLGQALRMPDGADNHVVKTGCVVHGAMAWGKGLSDPVAIAVTESKTGRRMATIPLERGESAATRWFAAPSKWAAAGDEVTVSALGSATIEHGGGIVVEIAESMAYRPSLWDLFTVLRLAGFRPIA